MAEKVDQNTIKPIAVEPGDFKFLETLSDFYKACDLTRSIVETRQAEVAALLCRKTDAVVVLADYESRWDAIRNGVNSMLAQLYTNEDSKAMGSMPKLGSGATLYLFQHRIAYGAKRYRWFVLCTPVVDGVETNVAPSTMIDLANEVPELPFSTSPWANAFTGWLQHQGWIKHVIVAGPHAFV